MEVRGRAEAILFWNRTGFNEKNRHRFVKVVENFLCREQDEFSNGSRRE